MKFRNLTYVLLSTRWNVWKSRKEEGWTVLSFGQWVATHHKEFFTRAELDELDRFPDTEDGNNAAYELARKSCINANEYA